MPASVVDGSQPAQRDVVAADLLHNEVSSYDDLRVSVAPDRTLMLECPACGFLPIPLRETTLSDLTNAAMDHLSERHSCSLTLPAPRTRAPAELRGVVRRGNLRDHFWSLVTMLDEEGVEVLVRALASSSREEVLTFQEQLNEAADLLDTPAHRMQQVRDVDDPRQTVSAVMSDDVFAAARMAVVASGRESWLSVFTEPARLSGQWSLQTGRVLAQVPTAALNRTSPVTRQHSTSVEEMSA